VGRRGIHENQPTEKKKKQNRAICRGGQSRPPQREGKRKSQQGTTIQANPEPTLAAYGSREGGEGDSDRSLKKRKTGEKTKMRKGGKKKSFPKPKKNDSLLGDRGSSKEKKKAEGSLPTGTVQR